MILIITYMYVLHNKSIHSLILCSQNHAKLCLHHWISNAIYHLIPYLQSMISEIHRYWFHYFGLISYYGVFLTNKLCFKSQISGVVKWIWHPGVVKWIWHPISMGNPRGRINIKMLSYQYRKSHCGDKTILRPSYLHNEISYTDKMTSSYWIRAQVSINEEKKTPHYIP